MWIRPTGNKTDREYQVASYECQRSSAMSRELRLCEQIGHVISSEVQGETAQLSVQARVFQAEPQVQVIDLDNNQIIVGSSNPISATYECSELDPEEKQLTGNSLITIPVGCQLTIPGQSGTFKGTIVEQQRKQDDDLPGHIIIASGRLTEISPRESSQMEISPFYFGRDESEGDNSASNEVAVTTIKLGEEILKATQGYKTFMEKLENHLNTYGLQYLLVIIGIMTVGLSIVICLFSVRAAIRYATRRTANRVAYVVQREV